ncbi:hypothetical protein Cgig2_006498 [Carnegiea gigantea]|uniref:F-box domain-containing protein n=1 Tax=Carnegiea gigantea TaxID=171969 RepID=A0A9Q1GRY9_9CARY|nr:hypothetical protein Cgig2_006498 [Carnegiea gigantea]
MRSYSALPDEIIVDIIARLPAKAVGRCRCVCKSWRPILARPEFISDNYKIVIVSFCEDFEAEAATETFVSIYSLKTGTWKNVESPFCWHRHTCTTPGVFVDGSIHWIACTPSDYKPTIVAFDITKEAFCEVPPPPSVVGDMLVCHLLVALGGCLCTYALHEIAGWNVQEDIDIWVMKEYGIRESWIRFTVSGLGASTFFRPLCMLGQEQLVALKGREELTMCDLKEGTFKDIVVHGIPNKRTLAMTFVESLISPRGTYETGAK